MKIEKLMKRGLDQVVAMAEKGNENRYSTKIGNMQIEDDQFEFSLRLKKIQENKTQFRSFESIFGKIPYLGEKEMMEGKIQDVKNDSKQSPDFIQTCFDNHFLDAIQSSMFFRDKCETAKDLKADVAKPTNSRFQKKMDEMMEKAKKEKSPLQSVIERRMDQEKEKSAINNDTFQHICGAMDAIQNFVGSMQPKPSNEDGSGKNPNESVDDYQKSIADAVKLAGTKENDSVKKPTIGIIPQNVFLEKRLFAIQEAKNRFRESKTVIPSEWLREEKEIMEWFGAPKQPANFATEHRNFINGLIQGMKDEMIKNIDVNLEDVSKVMANQKERSGMIFTISANPGIKFPYGFHTDLFFQEMERRKKE